MNHIRDKLPDMKARLNTLMGQTQQELNAFGDSTFLGEQHRGSLILQLMTQFVRDFVASIDGTSLEISTKELCGGARIYYIFNDVFGHALESINPTHNLTVQDIRTAIRNSTGPRPSLFVPEVAFDLLVKPQIKLLEPPSLRCVELVYEELMKICHNCTSAVSAIWPGVDIARADSGPRTQELQRYPRLHAQLIEVVSELLRERLGPTSEYVQSLISIQAAYINTNHPDFVKGSAAAAQASSRDAQARRQAQLEGPKKVGFISTANRDALLTATGPACAQAASDDGAGENRSSSGQEDEEEVGYLVPNGRASRGHEGKTRSASSTIHDRGKGGPDFGASGHANSVANNALGGGAASGGHSRVTSGSQYSGINGMSGGAGRHQQGAQGSYSGGAAGSHLSASSGGIPPFASPYGASPSSSSAKESFLNYFFGGSEINHAAGAGSGSSNAAGGSGQIGGAGGRGLLNATDRSHRSDNPLIGRRGLEGNAAAFDMKSLDKHLEAVSLTRENLAGDWELTRGHGAAVAFTQWRSDGS